jgi:diguanylate cyclase (GGDEF)-like protein/PAS domain S-box-containing protein
MVDWSIRVPQEVLPSGEPGQHRHDRLLSLGEKLNRLRYAFLSAPIALCLIDEDLRYVELNERMAALNCRPIEAHIGRTLREIVPDIADAIEPVYRQVFATGQPVESRPLPQITEEGQRFLLVSYNPVQNESGRTVLVSVAVFDVTEETKARDAAHASAQQLRDVLESTSDNVVLLSSGWQITYVNGHAARLFAPLVLAIGQSLSEIFPGWIESEAGRRLMTIGARRQTDSFTTYSTELDRWLQLDVFPTPDGLSVFFRDISERRRAADDERRTLEKIAYLANHDSLTGLENRQAFYKNLDRLMADAGPDPDVALLYLDLDGFKAVNDTMGHPVGDATLVAVAERLRRSVRNSDIISRFGGDEFVIAVSACGGQAEVCVLADRIIASLSATYAVGKQVVSIGVSIGIALAEPDMNGDELVRQADTALYAAKADGRRSYRFFESAMDEALLMNQLRKRELEQALARNEFHLDYQPIVNLETRRIEAFEALLRCRNVLFTDVPMESVVALAEETGLIRPIGDWVLREACQEAALWPDTVSLAVKVSVLQLRERSFGETVKRILADTTLAPTRLTLEITETVLIFDEKLVYEALEDLRRHGVKISLDDFGKGYASLQYIKALKVDKIKIDQSFVRDAHADMASIAVIRAVVTLARDLDVVTIAEGIELESQCQLLRRLGCAFGQGFFLGRPMSGEECRLLI